MGIFDRFKKEQRESDAQLSPRGASGRAHYHGFLDFDELNNELRGQQGFRIFDQMYRQDGDVKQVVGLSTNPVISGTWDFNPAGGNDAEAKELEVIDFLKWALWTAMSPNLIGHLAEALPVLVRAGIAPFEEIWMRQEFKGKEYLVLKKLDLRLPKTIVKWNEDNDGNLIELVQQLPVPHPISKQSQVTLDMKNVVYYRIGAEGNNWEGTSLLRPAYKHWKLKDAIERIDAIAQEREAVGIPICYPPQGASPAQLESVEEVLANIRANEQGYIVAPGPHAQDVQDGSMGWRIDILGFDRNGSGRDPQPSLKYHTQKIMASFIAEFMMLGHNSSGGARATAQVQANPFLDSVETLASIVEEVLNEQIVAPLVRYNFPDVEEIPRLTMSLVDSTSLTQMSDFVSRLVQVGAILPDQKLENWLRERAELPPPDPKAVQARGDSPTADFDTRREALTGPAMDPFGGGGGGPEAGTGGGRKTPGGFGAKAKPGLPHGNKATPQKLQGAASLDTEDDAVTLDRRPPDKYEANVALDDIDYMLDAAPDQLVTALRDHITRAARFNMGLRHSHRSLPAGIQDTVRGELQRLSDYGYETADHEIRRQMGDDTVPPTHQHHPVMMSKTRMDDMDLHAEVGAEHIYDSMKGAYKRATLMGHDAQAQSAAEQAGYGAAKQVARNHGFHAFNVGRNQRILDQGDGDTIGVRYTSVLDRNRCAPCGAADDGVVRSLDDPVRIENQPPNKHCMSLMGGFNNCRCFEVPVVMGGDVALDADLVPNDPAKTNWIEKRGGLPKKIADMAGDLISERGMDTSRAIATAVSNARKLAPKHPEWAAAVAEWDAKRAAG